MRFTLVPSHNGVLYDPFSDAFVAAVLGWFAPGCNMTVVVPNWERY